MSHRNQTLHKLELFGLALLLVIGIVFAGFSPPGQRQRIAKQASSPTVKQQEFEAKRKAEGEALGRHQSFQTH